MSDQVPVPPRYARVNAWVISADTEAEIRFLREAFGGVEKEGSRVMDEDGAVGHVEVDLGDSVLMLFDAQPDWPALPAHLRVYVGDIDATIARAQACGARLVTEPTLLAFGERVARLRDPQGHLWWVHQHVENVPPEILAKRLTDPATAEAMAYVRRTLREELSTASP
jgi:PhnB protein